MRTPGAQPRDLRAQVGADEGQVVHAFAVPLQEAHQEPAPVRGRREQLHPAAGRVLELQDAEAFVVGHALPVFTAQEICPQPHGRAQLPDRDADVVEPQSHGA
jgi:hypothetical protein